MSIPTLETGRLMVRGYTLTDLDNRHRLMAEAFGDNWTLDDARDWLTWTVANYRELDKLHQPPYGDYAIVLKASGEVIGSVGLVSQLVPWNVLADRQPQHIFTSPEFGLFWAMFDDHRGKGYAPEAAQAVIEFTFSELHAARVVATTEHENVNSQRVMQKLGMTIHKNPGTEPFWFEVVGVRDNPLRTGQAAEL